MSLQVDLSKIEILKTIKMYLPQEKFDQSARWVRVDVLITVESHESTTVLRCTAQEFHMSSVIVF